VPRQRRNFESSVKVSGPAQNLPVPNRYLYVLTMRYDWQRTCFYQDKTKWRATGHLGNYFGQRFSGMPLCIFCLSLIAECIPSVSRSSPENPPFPKLRISPGRRRSAGTFLWRRTIQLPLQASTSCSCISMPACRSNFATASAFNREASKNTRAVRSFSLN
jgi:hypothetical protein